MSLNNKKDSDKFRALPIVEIEWIDSTGDSGWAGDNDHNEPINTLITIRSSGYLLQEDGDRITICQSMDNTDENKTDNRLTIPKSLIMERTELVIVDVLPKLK